MGKLTKSQLRRRRANVAEGREPYQPGHKAIPRGRREVASMQRASDHPGSKRSFRPRFPRLEPDAEGRRPIDWRKVAGRRQGTQRNGGPMGEPERLRNYERQNAGRPLTPAQRRRLAQKAGRR